jgi:hypothetical protein
MIGATTRNQYLYSFRMARIAEEFEIQGFWHVWPAYVGLSPKDTGSVAFYSNLRERWDKAEAAALKAAPRANTAQPHQL